MGKVFDDFNNLFESKLSHSNSRLESFEIAKAEFGKSYKNWESFKVVRSRKMKRKGGNHSAH